MFSKLKIQFSHRILGGPRKGLKFDLIRFRSPEMIQMKAEVLLNQNKSIAIQSGTWVTRSGRNNDPIIFTLKTRELGNA